MVQVDLITGFLGAGKTTFLRRYAAYLVAQCLHSENDFGAVNVDAMLVQVGPSDRCRSRRSAAGVTATPPSRMRTGYLAMRGFAGCSWAESGIFDVDEFFDVLRDDHDYIP